ncbi:MAG: hypothetical protein M1823_000275 [Watsoniomyces obsoletus]|nr:MAG: hypothetical protein M1823_000275 [Watsoniomyces obsoletus]
MMQSAEHLASQGANPRTLSGNEVLADDSRRPSLDEDVVDASTEVNASQALLHGQDSEKNHTALTPLGPRKRGRLQWRKWLLILAILVGGLLAIVSVGGVWVYKTAPPDGQSPPWYPTPRGGTVPEWQEAYEKASAMVRRMTLAEKVNITTGTGWMMGMCVGNTGPASHVGFPPLCLQDGPLGIRFADHITAFPAGITVGATWDRDLMYQRGLVHGIEARLKGINVLLGPSMGPLGKHPAGGRNWEGFGADPVLQAVGAAQTIRGIQNAGVIANAKHYIANEQEHFRQSFEWGLPNALSSNVDDRTLHELYLWPFAESVRAQVGSVMCSYQMVNNSYACGNSKLLNGILKDELGFQGFVISDWLAARSGVSHALAGLDMTMPGDGLRWQDGNALWGPQLSTAILNGSVPVSRLNDMVTRIVATWYKFGQDDAEKWPPVKPDGDGGPNFSSWTNEKEGLLYPGSGDNATGVVNKFVDVQGEGNESHGILARRIAAEGTVLVKNEENILPLDVRRLRGGETLGESSRLKIAVIGEDAGAEHDPNGCPDRGCNLGTLASGWGSGAVEFPYLITPIEALKAEVDPERIELTLLPTNNLPLDSDPTLLDAHDICLVFANSDGGEGFLAFQGIRGDRNDLHLQKDGDALVQNVATKCGNGQGKTIVVIHAVGPVVVENWVDLEGVKAVVFANLPGQESGNALVDVLFGRVNPSGKLPYTVGKSLEDYGSGAAVMYYPNGPIPQQDFNDGLYIDYRHFDKFGVEPRYEFGYGLSYTTFELTSISATLTRPKTALPSSRPVGLTPPTYSNDIPPVEEVLLPVGFRRLHKYIYPYLDRKDAKKLEPHRGTGPVQDDQQQSPLSPAGGGEGGNPSLWDVHAEVKVTLTNTGHRPGKEVVQLYVSFPTEMPLNSATDGVVGYTDHVEFPPKVLRAFQKVELQPKESQVITFHLTRKDLSYWSTTDQNWIMPTLGKFTVHVGNSSRHLPLTAEL